LPSTVRKLADLVFFPSGDTRERSLKNSAFHFMAFLRLILLDYKVTNDLTVSK